MASIIPKTIIHRYRPIGKCSELFSYRGPEVLLSGPAGTGKSRACLEKIHAICLRTPGVRALIVRKTRESLSSTALVTYREHVARQAIESGEVWFYGGSKEEAAQYRYQNGSSITIGGMDKSIRIMSSEYDICYVQEATELTVDDWEAITSRLRNNRISFQQIIADCNPDAPTHWLKMRAADGDLKILESTHKDNPTLYNPDTGKPTKAGTEYLAKLNRLTGVRKRRLLYGEWCAAEGIVYESFDPAVHIIDPFEIPRSWPRYWGIDFGYTNPFVLGCWAHDMEHNRLYLYREIYYSKRLVETHAEKIMSIVAPKDEDGVPRWIEPQPRRILADWDAEGRATFTLKTGLRTQEAHKAVTEGIQAVEERLQLRDDGKPGLMIFRGATVERDLSLREAGKPTCTEEEFPGYVWAPPPLTTTISVTQSRTRELPGKENDHGMDSLRYVVAHHDMKRKARLRVAG
jgi:PBSX family phage terminase large subunit